MANSSNTPAHVITFDSPNLPITHVTVYGDRAEVKKSIRVDLKQGPNEVVVKKLVDAINSDSIRVEGYGSAVISEVKYDEKRITEEEKVQEKDKELNDRLNKLKNEKKSTEQNQERLKKLREVLDGLANQLSKGNEKSETDTTATLLDEKSINGLTEFLNFYDKQASKLDDEINQVTKKLEKLDEEIDVLENNLSEIHFNRFHMSKEVSIFVTANESGEAVLDLSYVVWRASWEPSYDIRVYTDDKTMEVYYYGNIKQTTDEDWKNSKITLSTAVPSIGGQVPELRTTKVGFYKPPPPIMPRPMAYAATMECRSSLNVMKKSRSRSREAFDDVPAMAVQQATVKENVTSTTFEIDTPTTIPSDKSSHKVTIGRVELKPEFHYESVPSKSAFAYFKAQVRNTGAYPFLEGPTAIFVDDNFVAKGRMKAVNTSEKFNVSLGVDPAVKIEYKAARKFHEESGILSKSALLTHEQKIGVHNTKKEVVRLTLLESLPQSTDEKIKVTLIEPSPSKNTKTESFIVNKENNIEWKLELSPGDKKELVLKYQIEHPKGEHLDYKEE